MKRLLIFIVLALSISCCYSQKDGKAYQYKIPIDKPVGLFVKFDYFRIGDFNGNKLIAKDFNGSIFLNDRWLLVKAEDFNYGWKDYRFDFLKENKEKIINGKVVRSWDAYPYGYEDTRIYIEYKENEYISILFISKNIMFYYAHKSLKDSSYKFDEYNVWYKKIGE